MSRNLMGRATLLALLLSPPKNFFIVTRDIVGCLGISELESLQEHKALSDLAEIV